MGWMLKGLLLLAGLFSLTLGFWPLWIPCFGYLGYSLWSATRRRSVYVMDKTRGEAAPPKRNRRGTFRKRYAVAGLLFVLALVASGEGGRSSPYVFLALGSVVLLSGVLHFGPHLSSVRPVPGSILLRSRWFPFSWTSLVEVKFATSQMARALSSIGTELLLTTDSERISVYLPMRTIALSAPQADRRIVENLAPIARSLSPKGAYVLPLDGADAGARLAWRLRPVDLAMEYGRDGVVSLNSTPFDALVLNPDGHLLKAAAGYVRIPNSMKEAATLPSAGPKLESQPLVWEALEVLGEKFQVKEADVYTNFLSSVCASRGEGLGERLVNEGREGAATVLINSLGAAQVELTRPQLRAIVRTYG
ncbi:MAG: hypothetical protein ABSA72_01785 [Nitrososphaerales archaeon]|jgi:hypothetical protein